ncbi:MAG: prenyltransferase [Thermoplasmata archaeon]|nr:prenyltransferase [Thermoplasmata archaeon]
MPIKGFLVLSRLPFLSPGIAALVTGIAIAAADGFEPEPGLAWMSVGGIALIMLATYYFNEYFDYEGDAMNKRFTKFSGGSRAIPDLKVPRPVARIAGWSAVALLVAIAVIYLLFYFDDFPCLLPLALYGAFCGIFYSHPPFQWSYQGVGEIVIGGCYGVLAIVSGYYIVSGTIEPDMVLVAIPASLTIFCVIVVNEFPDIDADRAVCKKNLVVRLGLKKASVMYAAAMAAAYPFMLATVLVGMSPFIALVGLPVLILCALAILELRNEGYAKHDPQSKMAAYTLLANLLSSTLFIPVVFLW